MKDFLASLDWMTLLSAIWTVILVPVGTQIYKYLQSKKLGKVCSICGHLDRNNWKWEWKAQAGKEWRSNEGLPRYIKTDEDRAEPFNE